MEKAEQAKIFEETIKQTNQKQTNQQKKLRQLKE